MAKRTPKGKGIVGKDPLVLCKELACLDIRLSGGTFNDMVAEGLYKTRSGARDAYHRALEYTVSEPAEQARALELTRLDKLLFAIWPEATGGGVGGKPPNKDSIKLILDIMHRRARYLGLDAAVKVDIAGMVKSMAKVAGVDYDAVMLEADALQRRQDGRANV